MDQNLQQFPIQDKFNPWSPWLLVFAIISAILLLLEQITMHSLATFTTGLPLELTIIVSLTITVAIGLCAWIHDEKDDLFRVPAFDQAKARGAYLTFWGKHLGFADPSNWSKKSQQNLLYIFDGMIVKTSFLDKVGVRHELQFRVHFAKERLTIDHFIAFYNWYEALFAAMPDAEIVLLHIRHWSSTEIFHIEFPYNPPLRGES